MLFCSETYIEEDGTPIGFDVTFVTNVITKNVPLLKALESIFVNIASPNFQNI